MKRLLSILVLWCLTLTLFAQDDPRALAAELTAHCKTDREKVKAIFHWITDNISYKLAPRFRSPIIGQSTRRYTSEEAGEQPDTSALKPLNERVACDVLNNRDAVCVGYARLFTTLCDFAGIRSEIIIGYARGNPNRPVSKFGVNHYWNAVFLEGEWQLLDATWASGFITSGGEQFVKEYDGNYFLTSPELFIKDHYPDDVRWTLLPNAKVPHEFRFSPFKQKSFLKYNFTSFFPAKGIIEAEEGETIRLELIPADSERDKRISPDMLVDSTLFTQSDAWVFLQPAATGKNGEKDTYLYEYKIPAREVEWLYLMYNDDIVLRYKIKVKKRKA